MQLHVGKLAGVGLQVPKLKLTLSAGSWVCWLHTLWTCLSREPWLCPKCLCACGISFCVLIDETEEKLNGMHL